MEDQRRCERTLGVSLVTCYRQHECNGTGVLDTILLWTLTWHRRLSLQYNIAAELVFIDSTNIMILRLFVMHSKVRVACTFSISRKAEIDPVIILRSL